MGFYLTLSIPFQRDTILITCWFLAYALCVHVWRRSNLKWHISFAIIDVGVRQLTHKKLISEN